MTTISISTSPDASATHAAVQRIANAQDISLQLASERKFAGGFFRESFALEAVIAAIRSQAQKLELKLHCDGNDPGLTDHLDKFCQFPSNRVALHLAHRIVDNRGRAVPHEFVHAARLRSLAEANDLEAFRSRLSVKGADLIATYDSGSRFPAMAYHSQLQGAVSQGRLKHFVQLALDRSGGAGRSASEEETGASLMKSLSVLVYETFQNTDQHALTEINGKEIARGARGVFLRVFSVPTARASGRNQSMLPLGAPPILNLAVHEWSRSATAETMKFAEIIVFDSGPGFAARLSGKGETDMSSDAEREVVKECFGPRRTSSLQPGRGHGLDVVVKTLAEASGIFRLRTGRVSLYGAFHKKTAPGDDLMSRVFPEQGRGTEMMLRGSVFDMVVPLFARV